MEIEFYPYVEGQDVQQEERLNVKFTYRVLREIVDPNNEFAGRWAISTCTWLIPGVEATSTPIPPGEYVVIGRGNQGESYRGRIKVVAGKTASLRLGR